MIKDLNSPAYSETPSSIGMELSRNRLAWRIIMYYDRMNVIVHIFKSYIEKLEKMIPKQITISPFRLLVKQLTILPDSIASYQS